MTAFSLLCADSIRPYPSLEDEPYMRMSGQNGLFPGKLVS